MSLLSERGRVIKLTDKARRYLAEAKKKSVDNHYKELKTQADKVQGRMTRDGSAAPGIQTIAREFRMWLSLRTHFVESGEEYLDILKPGEREEYISRSYQQRMNFIDRFKASVESYLKSDEHTSTQEPVQDVFPSDSASQITGVSKSPSVRERCEQQQRKAELLARQASMRKKHELEKARLELQLKEEELDLNTEIDIVNARKAVLDSFVKVDNSIDVHACKKVQENNVNEFVDHSGQDGNSKPGYVTLDECRTEIGSGMSNINVKHSSPIAVGLNDISHVEHMLQCLQLPRAELPEFSGDPLQYWSFIRQFEQAVERVTPDDGARLIRLMCGLSGKAKRAVQCCMAMSPTEGYSRARQILRDRFGHDYFITQAWITKLLNFPQVRGNESLQVLADEISNLSETLRAMGRLSEINTQTTLKEIVCKLPVYLQNRWRKQVFEIKQHRSPAISDLVSFVCAAAAEANDPVFGETKFPSRQPTSNSSNKQRSQREHRSAGTSFAATSGSNPKPERICILCSNNHGLLKCDAFKALTPEKRWDLTKDKQLCIVCLNPGHWSNSCKSEFRCTVQGCGRKHSKFLHLPVKAPESVPVVPDIVSKFPTDRKPVQSPPRDHKDSVKPITTCNTTGAGVKTISLPIIPVKVRAAGGQQYLDTYALLDSGSTNSFCSDFVLSQLGVSCPIETLSLTTLHGEGKPTQSRVVDLEVSDPDFSISLPVNRVYSMEKLPIGQPIIPMELENLNHLQGISFPHGHKLEVGLLIGQDNAAALVPIEVRRGKGNEPYAVRTVLGWTLNGPLGNDRPGSVISTFVQAEPEPVLSTLVEKFWKVDSFEEKIPMSENDNQVIDIWSSSITQLNTGHYQLPIPFKSQKSYLPNNRVMAEHRLKLLGKRLDKDPALRQMYTEEIHRLFREGFAEIAPDTCESGREWYIPHHPVFHPQKPGKLRVVFDCGAKFKGQSLNDTVFQGPYLTSTLLGTLTRFRLEEIAFMADITAMFYQVLVCPENRDVLRFLWWPKDDISQTPVVYRMRVHIFGGVWSPSCANFALRYTADANQDVFSKDTVDTVQRNFYMDDCLKSVPTVQDGIRIASELCALLHTGGFHLTKWLSNSRELLNQFPCQERAKTVCDLDLEHDTLPIERALGVRWLIDSDQLTFRIKVKDKPNTRRGILSVVGSVYDPIGLVSPFVLRAKLLLQELCRGRLGWDDKIPEDLAAQWQNWLDELPVIENVCIPRCIKPGCFGDLIEIQLHHFSDASLRAYGSVTYLRLVNNCGEIYCSFVLGRSRLAPLRPMTIPRMELSAATLSVKSEQAIRSELDLPITKSIFWTDSTIVIQYLRNETKRFQTFVNNRVAMILAVSQASDWRHVESKLNPADDISRGLLASDLLEQERWSSGPEFLWQSEENWPSSPQIPAILLDTDPEVKHTAQTFTTESNTPTNRLIRSYSSWYKLKVGIAWVLRVKTELLIRVRKRHGQNLPSRGEQCLTVGDLRQAEFCIVQYVQTQCFPEELKALSKDGQMVKKSSPLYRLSPVMHQGLLCIGGRLGAAPISYSAKHSRILPKAHHVVTLIIRHFHELAGHSGPEYVLSLIRQQYWIIKGRVSIKAVLSRCFNCRKHNSQPQPQRMADLPWDRVTPNQPPFSYVGLDLFGPFIVKRGRTLHKRYGCIFTCLAVRAIHLEVVHSMDTSSFLNAFHRFVCRRGKPLEVRCDNGSNLVGGEKELREAIAGWNQAQIKGEMKQSDIVWRFNPPTASHMGGVWERQIRSVRKVLTALLRQQQLDDEGLVTLMCQVEAIINGRPLTKLSDDPRDLEPLTPSHLLMLRSGPVLPPGLFVKEDQFCKRRWRQVQYLADLFWRRWVREYLPELQQRQKWLSPTENLSCGDLVLMVEGNAPRSVWPLGIVTDTHKGRDGLVRSVKVRTKTSIFTRPVDKLCLLEQAKADCS